jgi:hypothetical protein
MEHGRNIIAEFETLVDVDLGILRLIQIKYPNKKYMKDHVLKGDDYFLRCLLLERKNINPLSILFKDEYQENIDSILDDIYKNEIEEVYKLSEPLSLFGLMQTYKKNEAIGTCVLCKNIQQEQYIKRVDDTLTIRKDGYNVSLNNYDVFAIKTYKDILNYTKPIKGKSIYLMNYKYNLEDKDGLTIPLLEISKHVTDVNNLYMIDPYIDFKLPINQK